MTPEFLDQAEKTAKQFATGFRSLAKLCALASGLGDKKFPKKEAPEQIGESAEANRQGAENERGAQKNRQTKNGAIWKRATGAVVSRAPAQGRE